MIATRGAAFPSWAPQAAIDIWRGYDQQEARVRAGDESAIRECIERGEMPAETDVRAVADKLAEERGPSLAAMLGRLLTSEGAKDAWIVIQQVSCKRMGADPVAVTAMTCARGYMGPVGGETMTPKRRAAWIKKTKGAAEALAELLRKDSAADRWLWNEYHQLETVFIVKRAVFAGLVEASDNGAEKAITDTFHANVGIRLRSMAELLCEFAKRIEDVTERSVSLSKPGDANARRAYFVKYLTEGFEFLFGKVMRKEVAALTSVAFDADISEREVRRLAPSKKSRSSARE